MTLSFKCSECGANLATTAVEPEAHYLMNAAPELLAALKNLVARIEANGGIGEYIGGPAFVMEPARNAIAKAEGKSP